MSGNHVTTGPVGAIVFTKLGDGHVYEIEKLDPPLLRGAGLRHYRLWCDKRPCSGNQYHYELDDAVARVKQLTAYDHYEEKQALNSRISLLERSNRLLRQALVSGEFGGRSNDVWFEIKELVRMNIEPTDPKDIETQTKRIRVMLQELEGSR